MKKNILFLLIIASYPAFAQQDTLSQNHEVRLLQEEIYKLETNYSQIAASNSGLKIDIRAFEDSLKAQGLLIDRLQDEIETEVAAVSQNLNKFNNESLKRHSMNTEETAKLAKLLDVQEAIINNHNKLTNQNLDSITQAAKELDVRMQETEDSSEKKYAALGSSLFQNKVYGFFAVLAVAFLSVLGFVLLRRRAGSDKSQLVLEIQNTKKHLEEEGIKLDNKLVDILETQLKLLNEERTASSTGQEEVDHSLALKVADEIVRIEKNLSQMDEGTKGLKQLGKAVDRIKANFAANGYEMVILLGKPFDDGMKLEASFRPDDSLKPEERIITRIIKPQVNYKGQMIQSAQVEVSQGE